MPQLGESIAEATIINFLVSPGDQVEADQNLDRSRDEQGHDDCHFALQRTPREIRRRTE